MKKTILISLVFLSVGFIAEAYSIVTIFAIDPDLLGVPYSNTPVIANNDVLIKQGNIELIIPKGTTLQYGYSAKDQPYYSLHIVGWPFEERPFEQTTNWNYFFVDQNSSK